ncbi:hypothetical protein PAV_5c03960 [Paenibacillus alvei DSM 29]|uniref:hypothetical protein n=1 Tax=Paenibacillus alvei TaxID=44250 RepID=UPI0002885DF5|nr:hypothetical protein [Paenibacillus alvei]EJW16813.1 hypothetical protein PAV_5c03960 [Paenibacillus alvei DSM 29]
MKINNPMISPKLYDSYGQSSRQMRTDTGIMNGVNHDSVEISPTGRQLAVGAIEHHVGSYYGNADIDDSLQRILEGKSPEIKKLCIQSLNPIWLPAALFLMMRLAQLCWS